MPVTYLINHKARFIETRCTGEVTFDEVMNHFKQLEAGQLLEVARAVDRLKAKVQWGACAIIASGDALFGMSRMFEAFAEGSFARIAVFRRCEEAKQWLALSEAPSV